jgi:hypothetical protein
MMDGQKAREVAVWAVPMFLALAGLGLWVTVGDVVPTLRDLARQAPSLRLRSLSLLMPLFTLFCLLTAALFPLRILRMDRAAGRAQAAWLVLTAVLLALAPVVSLGSSWLQRHYLPPLGYHYCDKLDGNPTVWFNDWVKDPAWCVYGKDHAWVRAQAQVAAPEARLP